MKYCSNPECPYALRHQEAAEYRDEAVSCSDCGAELTPAPPVPTPAARKRVETRWDKIGLTILAPLLFVWLGQKLRMPGLDAGQIEDALNALAGTAKLSVLALGLGPVITASVMVEVAALCRRRWRSLRHGGPAGRGRLWLATGRLALTLAIVQALGVAMYMERLGLLEGDPGFSRLIIVLTLAAGTFSLVALAQLLDRAALGGGFSLLVTAFAMVGLLGDEAWRVLTVPSPTSSAPVTLAGGALLVAIAGSVFFLRWQPLDADGRRSTIPLPACGVIPLTWAASTVATVITVLELREVPPPAFLTGLWGAAITLTLTAGFAMGLGFLFNQPSKVAAFSPGARDAVRRAVTRSTGYVLGLGVLGWFIDRQLVEFGFEPGFDPLSLIPLVMVVAVVLDVIAEAGAVRRHGDLVSVWPEHRLHAVEDVRDALHLRGIPSVARSVHQRALWHFLAPFIPIQIMVPKERAEEAGLLLLEHFRAMERV